MANSPRTQARDAVVKAAEAAQDAQAADGDFAPLDIIRIAADYAARYAVLSGKFGLGDDQAQLGDQLRKEFLARVAHWEDVYLKGGEVVVLSEKPKVAIRSIELHDRIIDEQAKKPRRRP